MSLFPVNRYLCDEDDGANEEVVISEDSLLERKRLKKLLKKAKARKSQAIVNSEEGKDVETTTLKIKEEEQHETKDSGQSNKNVKRKRDKSSTTTTEELGPKTKKIKTEEKTEKSSDTNAIEAGPKKGKKKKKKAKAALTGTELGVDFGGFTVIGDVNQFRQKTVKRILPEWLANPSVISCNLKDDKAPIDSFGLDSQIVQNLKQNFIPYFFPVQQQIIPWLISCHNPKLFRPSDICVSAPTGSGKTLAYALPVINILKTSRVCPCVRAIVVLPTEVLATQVYSVFKTYSAGSGLTSFLMTKRLTLSAEKDALVKNEVDGRLSTPFDIIIATPGRLIDHLEQTEGFDVSNLKFLVVDEADRTLDDQEGDWLQRLEIKFWASHPIGIHQPWKSLPLTVKWMEAHGKAFQKLLFSATLSQNPEALEKLHLFQPKLFTSIVDRKPSKQEAGPGEIALGDGELLEAKEDATIDSVSDSFVGKYSTPKELQESFVLCKKETKPLILTYLISHFKWKRVLCFTNTKENTHRLCLLLKFMGHLNVREVSSKWNPKTRDIVLKKFAEGSIDILVISDQMARGIDIPTVDYVISYDLPGYTKTYIHRIGRCARAGREGQAVSLITQDQIGIYKKTMKETGKSDFVKIPVKNVDLRPLEGSFKEALAKLKIQVDDETDPRAKKLKAIKATDSNKSNIVDKVDV